MLLIDVVYVHRLVGGEKLAWHGRYHAHGPAEYEFHCFLEGQGSFLSNRRRLPLEGGRLFLTRPREFHSILPEALTRPISYYAILFEPEPGSEADAEALGLLDRLGRGPAEGDAEAFRSIEGRDRFLIEELHQLFRAPDPSRRRAASYLLLSLIHRWYGQTELPEAERKAAERQDARAVPERNPHVERALSLMDSSIREKLGSAELAERLGISEEHFIRLFGQELGMSPFQYFTRLKAAAASAYMAETGRGVAEVAEHFGFENPFHFSRVFKKCTGLSPAAYRRIYSLQTE